MIITKIEEVIGNTPLFLIDEKIHQIPGLKIYAKCEFLNPFWSVKDRTAIGLLEEAGNHEWIIESSSGNTAKALGALARVRGKKLLDVSRKMPISEVEDIIRIIGADMKILPPGSECPDPSDPNSPLEVIAREMRENPKKYFFTDQFSNPQNAKIHETTTAREIENDIGTPDFFFAGLGTTGSSLGVHNHFSASKKMKTVGIITAGSSHLPGIRNSTEMFDVGLFDSAIYEDFQSVNEQNAIDEMLTLIRKCGLLVGPTSGATFFGMKEFFKKQPPESLHGKTAVFIACDRLEPYTGYLRHKKPELFEENSENFSPKNPEKMIKNVAKTTNDISDNAETILIDMRSQASYQIEHIRGSICMPFEMLKSTISNSLLPFSKSSEIIFICPIGEESALMAQMAENFGYRAKSLTGGFLEYREKHPEKLETA